MIDAVRHLLSGLPKEVVVFIISALPISELRGGIPVAIKVFGMNWRAAYLICAAGNFLPIIPILYLLGPLEGVLRRWPPMDRFMTRLFDRTVRRGRLIEKYEALGLIAFVAIPLPVTGAWTGALAAHLFGVRPRYAIPAIICGILIAGVIVTLATQGVLHLWRL
jgi:uncharacterized membrane protein